MSSSYIKELEERLAAIQKERDDLKINCVYGFFTSDKRLFYAGQTEHFGQRIQKHFEKLLSKKKVFFCGI
jgi:hypothetical protein